MLNRATLIGIIVGQPENHGTGTQVIVSFPLVTKETYRGGDGEIRHSVQWHRISCFGAIAVNILKKGHKNTLVCVEGKIATHKYTDKKGVTRYTTTIQAKWLTLLREIDHQEMADLSLYGPADLQGNAPEPPDEELW